MALSWRQAKVSRVCFATPSREAIRWMRSCSGHCESVFEFERVVHSLAPSPPQPHRQERSRDDRVGEGSREWYLIDCKREVVDHIQVGDQVFELLRTNRDVRVREDGIFKRRGTSVVKVGRGGPQSAQSGRIDAGEERLRRGAAAVSGPIPRLDLIYLIILN